MPGVLFVVCVPTAEYEKSLLYGTSPVILPSADIIPTQGLQKGPAGKMIMCNILLQSCSSDFCKWIIAWILFTNSVQVPAVIGDQAAI